MRRINEREREVNEEPTYSFLLLRLYSIYAAGTTIDMYMPIHGLLGVYIATARGALYGSYFPIRVEVHIYLIGGYTGPLRVERQLYSSTEEEEKKTSKEYM